MIGKEILNYRIVSLIGKGGMGSVYLGEHKFISKQKAAIKVINADMVNEFTKKCLKEEAEHLAGLNHHNIVAFHDYDIDEKGNIYLVMEYADGKSLEDYINTVSGLIVEEKICPFFEPILDAVGYAHKHNIIHRDIKPSNIIITTDGTPKILDFGIATIIKKEEEDKDHLIMGTPSYMSPEQVKGEHLDERSDIYSLGVLLHQMLTGNAPYDTTTLTEFDINKKVIEEPLPRLKTYYKYVSEKVQKVVDKATAKNPEDRYQSCAEFKKALHLAVYPPKISKWVWTSIAACIVLIIGAGIYYWDYNRTKVYYYKDYAEQWGVPQGIGELSEKEKSHVNRLYRFEYCKRKLLRVSHINSKDKIIEDEESERNERPIDQWLYYTENGKVSRVKVKDRNGKVLYVKAYNDKLNTLVFQYDDEHGTERTMSGQTVGYTRVLEDTEQKKGRISRWWLEYDDNGYISSIRYANLSNQNVGDDNNIYGRTYIRDNKGRAVEIHYIGKEGQPQPTKWGLGIKKFYYDEKDNWIRAEYYTIDGKPAYDDTDGICIYEMEYDDNGNIAYALHKDSDGELMIPKKNGIAGMRSYYDHNGFRIKTEALGVDRQPSYDMKLGVSASEREYDENGFIVKETYLDIDGKKCESKDKYTTIEIKRDDCGNIIEAWTYNTTGELCESSEEEAGFQCEYDSLGNMIKRISYGTDRKPCVKKNGSVGYVLTYNDMNLLTSQTYLGKDLKPTKCLDGVCHVKIRYDTHGNQIHIAFYDESKKKLVTSDENVAGWDDVYDEKGNHIERIFFDERGKPGIVSGIAARYKYTFDENSNLKSSRYYNSNGDLMLVDGVAGNDYVRDERGNILESKEIGLDGKLAKNRVAIRYKYDKFDNEIESSVYDKNGEATVNSWHVHRWTSKYNSRNQMTERRYYDTKGSLALYNNKNYAIEKYEYNNKGNIIKCYYYGTDSKPAVCDEGWSKSTYEHNAQGKVIKQCFYGIDGKPTDPKVMVPVGICKYDKWGNMIYLAAQDGHGRFIANPNTGWAISRMTYDRKSNVTSYTYFNDNDKPALCKEGYHKVIYAYNNSSKKIEECYFGTDGKPMLINKVHKIKYEYDSNGNETLQAFYGTDGKPVNASGGYHKYVITYDANGTANVAKFYQANGKLYGSMKWNGEKWIMVDTPSTPVTTNVNQNWKSKVEELDANLPTSLNKENYTLIIQSIKVTGASSCENTFKISVSKYELNETQLQDLQSLLDKYVIFLKNELGQGITVTCVLYDSKGRKIYTTRK